MINELALVRRAVQWLFMAGNSPVRYAKLDRALLRGGAEMRGISGSHHKWLYRDLPYPIPVHGG